MKFKNDKARIDFLEKRKQEDGWYRWKVDEDLGRVWWRRDFDDCFFVVETRRHTIHWPEEHEEDIVFNWYIIKDSKIPFEDGRASRTLALKELKRMEAAT